MGECGLRCMYCGEWYERSDQQILQARDYDTASGIASGAHEKPWACIATKMSRCWTCRIDVNHWGTRKSLNSDVGN